MLVTFKEIKRKKKISLKCNSCDKHITRTISVSQTINPFNKNKDGSIKTMHEIEIELFNELKAKIEDIKTKCIFCKKGEEEMWEHNETLKS
jgi:hypothetical protein